MTTSYENTRGSVASFFLGPHFEAREGSVDSAGGDSPLMGIVPPARPTLDAVNPETAIQIGTVWRSVDIISTSVSQMEMGVYRNGIEIPAPSLIKNPNVNEPASATVQETVWSLALWGNAYWRLYGDPVQTIEVLDPASVTVGYDEKTGKKTYWVGQEKLATNKIKHLKLQRPPGRLLGVGPVQCAKDELTAALLLRKFQNDVFNVTGIPTGVLTTDMQLSETQSAEYAALWNDFVLNGGGTVVLSQGLSYEQIRHKPADVQFLEVQEANNKNIARVFGIPAMHLSVEIGGTSMTYMNLEQSNILFIQNCLSRYMNEIENNLSDLLPRGQRVQFKEEGLLRSDTKTKWEIYKTQTDIGYTSGNELRKAEGKAPLTALSQPKANPVNEGDDNTNE